MQTKDLSLHNGGKRKKVKKLGEIFPYIGVSVLSVALVIEPIP